MSLGKCPRIQWSHIPGNAADICRQENRLFWQSIRLWFRCNDNKTLCHIIISSLCLVGLFKSSILNHCWVSTFHGSLVLGLCCWKSSMDYKNVLVKNLSLRGVNGLSVPDRHNDFSNEE